MINQKGYGSHVRSVMPGTSEGRIALQRNCQHAGTLQRAEQRKDWKVHCERNPTSNNNNIPGTNQNGSHHDRVENRDSDSQIWKEAAFPQYMQESVESSHFCDLWEDAKRRHSEQRGSLSGEGATKDNNALWLNIRREAERDAKDEPLLSSFLYASILSHDSFERSLAFILSNRLSNATLLPTELFELFYVAIESSESIKNAAQADLCALRERDPACRSYSQALLYFKGFHALQVQRISHALWKQQRRVMAAALQSRSSEVFAVDIHPAATIGRGVLLDHGTGVVIGETAIIGNNVSILQNVTLGGTGKQHGDRHPKVSDNVLIGASATILGNISIGKGSQVAAGSLVLKDVAPKTMVAGSPAKEVGKVQGNPALNMEQWYGSKIYKVQPKTTPLPTVQKDEDCVDVFMSDSTQKSASSAPDPIVDQPNDGTNGSSSVGSVEKDDVIVEQKRHSAQSSAIPTDSIDWVI